MGTGQAPGCLINCGVCQRGTLLMGDHTWQKTQFNFWTQNLQEKYVAEKQRKWHTLKGVLAHRYFHTKVCLNKYLELCSAEMPKGGENIRQIYLYPKYFVLWLENPC